MLLGNLLNIQELADNIVQGFIRFQRHPTLPLAILNYSNECMFNNYWPETVQICRGLIIDTTEWDKGNTSESVVISRPFHKFFNLNQSDQPDYQEANLPKVIPTITEKMDGWFGSMWKYGDRYGIASRGSFVSPGAEFGTSKLAKLIKYGAVDEFPKGYTPIFEIIFKAGKVVVDYPFEGLVLLALVNIETGEELPYDELRNVWAKIASYSQGNPWIRLVHAHKMDLQECNSYITKNFEGFVLSYPRPGTWPIKVKIKLEEYKRLHKLITGVTPQQIWKALHDPMAPWLDGGVPDHFREWAIKWRDELYQKFHTEYSAVQDLVHSLPVPFVVDDTTKLNKDWYEIMKREKPELAGIGMSLINGKIYEVHQAIWKRIRPVGRELETFYREGKDE